MRSLSLVLMMAAAPLAGCDFGGELIPQEPAPGDPGGGTGGEDAVRQSFAQVIVPKLAASCDACHAGGGAGPDFAANTPDKYTVLTGWQMANGDMLLDCAGGAASPFVTYVHPAGSGGMDWMDADKPEVVTWIDSWAMVAARCGGGGGGGMQATEFVTAPVIPVLGENVVDLTDLGAPGSALVFNAEEVAGSTYLTQIALLAGQGGIHAKHPHFESCNQGIAALDPADKFSAIDAKLPEGITGRLGDGTLSLLDVPLGTPLAVRFEIIEPLGGPMPPYKDLGGACAPPPMQP